MSKINNSKKSERANIARKHTKYMAKKYANEIDYSIRHTITFTEKLVDFHKNFQHFLFGDKDNEGQLYKIMVEDKDTVSSLFAHKEDGKACILNFASFKNPGGGFINGTIAQEESLCHESFLYNVLSTYQEEFYDWNRKNLNHSLYLNRALYSKDIVFERGNDKIICDVLTCACPNWRAAKDNGVTKEENSKVLRERIRFILMLLVSYERQLDTIILGAFGCGVFMQNPMEVATIFKEEIQNIYKDKKMNIVFAIPSGNDNLIAFQNVFHCK